MQALQIIAQKAVNGHWQSTFDPVAPVDPSDWENARRFYYSTEKNKALLRKLLRRTTESDQQWRLSHPPNAKFLADLRANGFDASAWLASFSKMGDVQGKTWTVQLEQDPLRVLQMGNWFGTCLSVEDINAFAAIANAVEINKQVLYLRDERGVVIGRKLLALNAQGCLFGFRSYGAGSVDDSWRKDRPLIWVKILFDLACLEIARRINGRLFQFSDDAPEGSRLELAADWYDDGPEEVDWWVARADLAEALSRGDRDTVAEAVLTHIQQTGLDMNEDSHRVPETLRALLWLGDSAGRVVHSLGASFFPRQCARFLREQSPSAAVQALFGKSSEDASPRV